MREAKHSKNKKGSSRESSETTRGLKLFFNISIVPDNQEDETACVRGAGSTPSSGRNLHAQRAGLPEESRRDPGELKHAVQDVDMERCPAEGERDFRTTAVQWVEALRSTSTF